MDHITEAAIALVALVLVAIYMAVSFAFAGWAINKVVKLWER